MITDEIIVKAAFVSDKSYFHKSGMDVLTDTQFLICKDNNYIYLSFRGTTGVLDWITNIKYFHQEYPYCGCDTGCVEVRSGFLVPWAEVRDKVLSLRKFGLPLVVTGHSLGAAIAQIAYPDLVYSFKKYNLDVFLVGFGSPKVGKESFVKLYETLDQSKIVLFRNLFDLVTYIPFGDKHCITPTTLNEVYFDRGLNPIVSQHMMKNYINSIRKKLCQSRQHTHN